MKIKGSAVLVTGANRGLGLAFSKVLLERGAAKVYAAARDVNTVKLPGVIPVALDVTNKEQILALASELADVSLVINNAGIANGSSFMNLTAEDAARSEFETNFFGLLRMAQAFAPSLKNNGGGAIINVLSVLSWLNVPGSATYSASKSAAWSLTNGLRGELRHQNTQVVAVHVGYMDTDMASHIDLPKTSPLDVAIQTLDVLESNGVEVFADDLTRHVKAELSSPSALYLSIPNE